MSVRITTQELFDALASAASGTAPEDARTVTELSDETGLSADHVRAALQACQRAGRLMVHHVSRVAIDGRRARVPAYTITPLATAKRTRK